MTTWTEGQELRSPEEVQAAKADGCGVEYRTPDGHWYPCTCSGRMNGLHRVASVPVPVYPEPMRAHDAWLAVERGKQDGSKVEALYPNGKWVEIANPAFAPTYWKDKDFRVIVRVTPKPTVRVPWYEARGRKLPDGRMIVSAGIGPNYAFVADAWLGTYGDAPGPQNPHEVHADADGQVEVLPVEGEDR